MQKVKIAVIGTGRIGRIHLENIANLRDQYELTYVVDPFNPDLAAIADKYKIDKFSKDYQDALSDKEVQAVVIASSTNTHAEIIEAASNAGKAVFCEKPVDSDIGRIKEILRIVAKNQTIFQVGFNRRFDHNFKRIHDYVVAGNIGEPQLIKISSRDPEPPSIDYLKISGGLFSDMMIHDLDMVRYLSNSEVTEVYARGAVLVNSEIEKVGDIDTAIVSLQFTNGALGVIDNSRQAVYGYDQRAEVFGSKGQATSQNDRLSTVELDTKEGSQLDKIPFFFLERYAQAYASELQEFYNCIVEKKVPSASGIDGLKSVELAVACLKSLKENRPIRL
ncbi:inositol 2-dehydrogenase [Liquorilactobacillus hordei]|uniref:inositol 2-dehydrogenase n=1 Tax=Liquorilactobacillus hordei TaxID=468911 RepID=UPI0039E8F62F